MSDAALLSSYGLQVTEVVRNASVPRLYEEAVLRDQGRITSTGALVTLSGTRCGRSPEEKRIVRDAATEKIWWGDVNRPLLPADFAELKRQAIQALNHCERLYVVDGFAGADPLHRVKVRVITSRPYHALFMRNMLIRPTDTELQEFGSPEMVIFNAGSFPLRSRVSELEGETAVALDLSTREMVILGTEYAGEMKKGVFTAMNYWMPMRDVLSMHCSATASHDGQVSLFFGLSGTGKTTLSADARRLLIGDDEHCWTREGVFNIEGGCYAKCIGLNAQSEPQIYQAIRFGTVLENVVMDPRTHEVEFDNSTITQNTRAAYPLEFVDNALVPSVAQHPNHIILLTCDAFGVLPPVSRLTPAQAMYHFMSGYTAKVAGTEVGVKEPAATFSSGFGAAFLVWHPARYAQLLEEKMRRHATQAWMINTGWTGGGYGTGHRIELKYTRAIIDAIHAGSLGGTPTRTDPVFGLAVPTHCPGCPDALLNPCATWDDAAAYERAAGQLATKFSKNFAAFADGATPAVASAGPVPEAVGAG